MGRAFVSGLLWSLRALQDFVRLLIGRRAWRVLAIFSSLVSVGFGHLIRVFLTETQARRVEGWRERLKHAMAKALAWWEKRPFVFKLALAVAVIFLQITLFPMVAQYVIIFPVKFLVPVIFAIARSIYGLLAETIIGKLYRKYFGSVHSRIVRRFWSQKHIGAARGAWRLMRLRYLTAWRLWDHNPKYRDASGERWVSLIEPLRLWWAGTLDMYVGHPLLAGKREAEGYEKGVGA